MEFGSSSRKPRSKTGGYVTRLQLYRNPPTETISLKEFEELAEHRLKMLQKLENIRQRASREGKHKGDKEYLKEVKNGPMKDMPLSHIDDDSKFLAKRMDERRRDHISHYILRLAYCRTEDMRRWFLNLETELLRARFHTLNQKDRTEFFSYYKEEFNFDTVGSGEEKQLSHKQLEFYKIVGPYQVDHVQEGGETQQYSFYKVPFTDALDLVQTRHVVVKQGFVYIPVTNVDMIASLVCNKFRQKLSEELVKTRNHLPVVDDDERISPMLKTIKHRYLGEDFTNVGSDLQGSISLAQIDAVSKQSFPPCMRHLHETVRREHHLRHFGRLQYGLFLKSIGLTLEQAMAFWRTEFVKKMDAEKFEKQYAYNVRHTYGKEGKRANYTPYSCMKIIMSNTPGQGDHHGCPFRHWDESHIRQMLTSHGVPHKGASSISSYAKDGHYQLACQRYYEITHAIDSAPFSLEHPTQYYKESRVQRGNTGVKQETTHTKRPPSPVIKSEQGPPPNSVKKEEEDFCGDISIQDIENFEEDMDQL